MQFCIRRARHKSALSIHPCKSHDLSLSLSFPTKQGSEYLPGETAVRIEGDDVAGLLMDRCLLTLQYGPVEKTEE